MLISFTRSELEMISRSLETTINEFSGAAPEEEIEELERFKHRIDRKLEETK